MLLKKSRFRELLLRSITAFFLLVLLFLVVKFLSPAMAMVVVGLLLLLSLWEWSRLFITLPKSRVLDFMIFASTVLYGVFAWYLPKSQALSVAFVFSGLWALVPFSLINYSASSWSMSNPLAFLGISCILIGWLSTFWIFRFLGAKFLFWSVFIIMSMDSCAYFIGTLFGRTPIAPSISPRKSFEGLCGSYIAAVLVLLISHLWGIVILPWKFSGADFFIAAIFVSYAVSGDLLESAVKRVSGVKDSGNLLPGHGGILDRFDSYFSMMPLLFCILNR